MFKLISYILIFFIVFFHSNAEEIRDIKVINNERISKETILIFAKIQIGEDYNQDDLNKILQFLGIEKFHIWSMAWGTRAALAYTSLFPQKICSAVFSDASIGKADVEAQKSGLKDALKKQDEAGLRRHDMPKGWNEHLNSESAQLSLSAAGKFDFTKVIKNINFPFLVMTGDHDPNLYSSKEIVEGSEIGRIKILEGVGHGSVLQRPDLALEGFLNWHQEIRDSYA